MTKTKSDAPIVLGLRRAHLKAALYCAAKNDPRYYLNGVLVEVVKGAGYVVGTNGHVLFAATFDASGVESAKAIIPREMLEGKFSDDVVSLTIGAGSLVLKCGALALSGAAVTGNFPEWRCVLPTTLSGEPGYYDANYVALLVKVAKEMDVSWPAIRYNGAASAGVMVLDDEALFLVMPMKMDNQKLPKWITDEAAKGKEIAATVAAKKQAA